MGGLQIFREGFTHCLKSNIPIANKIFFLKLQRSGDEEKNTNKELQKKKGKKLEKKRGKVREENKIRRKT
jgi:hypothetical protein